MYEPGMPTSADLANGRRVYAVLENQIGRANRLDSYQLASASGVYQPYISGAVRAAAMVIAPRGVVIGTVRGPGGGYFRAETKDEKDEVLVSRLLETHSHIIRDLAMAERSLPGLRGAERRRQIQLISAIENSRFQCRSALSEKGVNIGEFAEEDATV